MMEIRSFVGKSMEIEPKTYFLSITYTVLAC